MAYTNTSRLAAILAFTTLGAFCLAAGSERAYVVTNYAIAIDGANGGVAKSVDGGAITAEVVTDGIGNDGTVNKHLAGPKYEDLTIQMNLAMSKEMAGWIADSWTANTTRHKVTLTEFDYNYKSRSAREFQNALISSVKVPAMEASAKDAAYFLISIAPELIRDTAPVGKFERSDEKNQSMSNAFRLEIDGIDCKKVNKIDAFEVKREVLANNAGDSRDAAKTPGKINFPNLHIEFSDSSIQSFLDWHDQMVVRGQNLEKSGSLTFLSRNGRDELARIRFFNMGIFRVQPATIESGSEKLRRMSADLYVERMTFELLGGGAAANQSSTPDNSSTPESTAGSSTPPVANNPASRAPDDLPIRNRRATSITDRLQR